MTRAPEALFRKDLSTLAAASGAQHQQSPTRLWIREHLAVPWRLPSGKVTTTRSSPNYDPMRRSHNLARQDAALRSAAECRRNEPAR